MATFVTEIWSHFR